MREMMMQRLFPQTGVDFGAALSRIAKHRKILVGMQAMRRSLKIAGSK
jgi:hypothetical protein